MSYADVSVGDTGVGWTVVRGTEPRPFAVEVIGKYDDGILPDHDVILIRVSDMPGHQFIENNRGIWAGMSGSPVYIDDQLIGAVAYGFSFAPSTLGGVTPIEEMRAVGDAIDASATGLSNRLRTAVKRHGPAAAAASDFGRLPLPMAIPRGPTRGFRQAPAKRRAALRARWDLEGRLEARGLNAIPMAGRSVTRTARIAATAPVPGGNFAASLSYGTLDAYGVGTTTLVCDGRVLAFGHPMFHTIQSNLGAHLAESFDIVDDALGPYKLAAAGELIGRVVQDRTAAIAARLDQVPDVTELDSVATKGGTSRNGETFIAVRTPPFFGWLLAGDHAFFELLTLIDGFEDGSVGIDLDVHGKRANGSPFHVQFGDRWIGADRRGEEFFASADAGAFGTGTMLSWIMESGLEKVTVDTVDLDLDVGSPDRWVIEGMKVSRNGGTPKGGSSVCVKRGDELDIVLKLRSQPGDEISERVLEITVPKRFDRLVVRAGSGLPTFLDPVEFGDFGDLLAYLRQSRRSDEVTAKISSDGSKQGSSRTLLNHVTIGSESVALKEVGTQGC